MRLFIKWDTGHITINCEAFFPAPQKKLNILLKTINLDWKHKYDIMNQMIQFLKDLEQEMETQEVKIKSEYSKQFQKMKDLEHLISDCKHPNGVPISKVEIKTAKVDLKEQKKVVSGLKKSFKWSSKTAQKARMNQEIIAQKI